MRWEFDDFLNRRQEPSAGFKDDLWLDASGNPMGNAATLTERIRRPNFGALEVE